MGYYAINYGVMADDVIHFLLPGGLFAFLFQMLENHTTGNPGSLCVCHWDK